MAARGAAGAARCAPLSEPVVVNTASDAAMIAGQRMAALRERAMLHRVGSSAETMDYRRLGSTGVKISRLALGCGNFGGVGSAPAFFGMGETEAQAFALMDR